MIIMRKNKYIFVASIFLVSLLLISAASAADDTASDIVADTSDVAVLEESIDDANLKGSQSEENVLTEDPVSINTFTDLEEKIRNAEEKVELGFDFNNTEENFNDGNGIFIDHNLIINGNGYTIDGNGKGRIFQITDIAEVTFKDINFINANPRGDSYGGAIWASDGCSVKAINCNFTNNEAQYGAAVSGVVCENCNFNNNRARNQAGAMRGGAAINCNFIGNKADFGGAIYEGTATNCRVLLPTVIS